MSTSFAPSPVPGWSQAFAPRVRQTVSEWADAKRVLPQSSAAKGARWRTSTAPYLRGVMDSVLEPGVRKVALMKAAQTGGSEAIQNMVGYHIDHRPMPMLYVTPIHDDAEKASKSRYADMIHSTPSLRAKVTDRRLAAKSNETESTIFLKQFPGGFLAFGAAKTPNTFQAIAVNIAFGDDVDRWEALDEGDPADLLMNRVRTFHDGRAIFVSTPVLQGGRIDTLYSRSDQRRYFMPCPGCGHKDWITWNDEKHFRVVYENHDSSTARIECPECGGRWDEARRREMVDAGEWRPTATPQEPGLIGFHLPAMIATVGGVTLTGLVADWLTAQDKGREALKVFVNTSLGEGWHDHGTKVEASALRTQLEVYSDDVDVPSPVAVITAGVDVQIDRFALQVLGWGPGLERWLLDWRAIPGDPKLQETQTALLEALRTRYEHTSGHLLRIAATCVDSGFATDEIYSFCRAHWNVDHVYPTKGFAGHSRKPIVFKRAEIKPGKQMHPANVNVDDAKQEILAGLARLKPPEWKEGDPRPGYMHLPEHIADDNYLQEITAEHRELVHNKAGIAVKGVWVQDRANEALDTAVLSYAALFIAAGNSNAALYVRRQAALIASTPVPGAAPPRPAGERSAPPRPRVAPSSYLDQVRG